MASPDNCPPLFFVNLSPAMFVESNSSAFAVRPASDFKLNVRVREFAKPIVCNWLG